MNWWVRRRTNSINGATNRTRKSSSKEDCAATDRLRERSGWIRTFHWFDRRREIFPTVRSLERRRVDGQRLFSLARRTEHSEKRTRNVSLKVRWNGGEIFLVEFNCRRSVGGGQNVRCWRSVVLEGIWPRWTAWRNRYGLQRDEPVGRLLRTASLPPIHSADKLVTQTGWKPTLWSFFSLPSVNVEGGIDEQRTSLQVASSSLFCDCLADFPGKDKSNWTLEAFSLSQWKIGE